MVFLVQPASGSPARVEEEVFRVCAENSRFAQGHSRPTEMRKSHYGPLKVRLSCSLQATYRTKGRPGNLLLHCPTERGSSRLRSTYRGKKGETTGCVLPLVLPCFIGLPGLWNIWLFTAMVKGQTQHHSCTRHESEDSTREQHTCKHFGWES